MIFEPHRPHGMSDDAYVNHLRELILTIDRIRDYCMYKETHIDVPGGDPAFNGSQDSMFRVMYKLGYGDFARGLVETLGHYCRKLEYELLRVHGPTINNEEDGA